MKLVSLSTGLVILALHPALLPGQIPLQNPLAVASPATGVIAVEAESLLNSSIATHGRAARQNMRPFGPGWSGNEQLFWSVAQLGAQLRLTFKTAVAGRYNVYLLFTRAPDYAFARASFDGAPSTSFNGYAPTVSRDSAFLGMLDLTPGLRELLVEVAMKDGKSGGLNVGLDRIELRPVGAGTGATGRIGGAVQPIGRAATQPVQPQATTRVVQSQPPSGAAQVGPVLIAGPRLAFAQFTADGPQALLGADARNVYRADLTISLTWQANDGGKLKYRWQVASQPFPNGLGVSATPPGLLGEDSAILDHSRSFRIDLGKFPPLATVAAPVRSSPSGTRLSSSGASQAAGLVRVSARPVDFNIRIIPILDGKPAGSPSNMVIAHLLPGAQHDVAADALAAVAEREKHLAEMTEQAKIFTINFAAYKPMIFEDPTRWGCVHVIRNPYAGKPGHMLQNLREGTDVCGATYRGEGHTPGVWDVVTGWAKAYDIAANFYDAAKSYVASKIAKLVPCEWMGDNLQDKCEGAAHDLASAGISAGLVAAGIPPTLPNLKELKGAAEGKVVDVAVDYTCDEFETHGGQCTPEQRAAMAKAYHEMVAQTRLALIRETKEPGCGNVALAHENGREPLPCFTTYPGVDVRPATGAVTELPMVFIRVTRVRPNPPFPMPGCRLSANLSVKNYFPGAEINGHQYKAGSIQGDAFEPEGTAIPPLPVGGSMLVTLPFTRFSQFYLPDHHHTALLWDGWFDWQYLYKGGTGTLGLGMRTILPVAGAKQVDGKNITLPCAEYVKSTIQIPK